MSNFVLSRELTEMLTASAYYKQKCSQHEHGTTDVNKFNRSVQHVIPSPNYQF